MEGLIETGEDERVADGEEEAPAVVASAEPVSPAAAAAPSVMTLPAEAAAPLLATAAAASSDGAVLPAVIVATTPSVVAPAPGPIVVVRPPRPCRIDFEGFSGTEPVKVEVRAWLDRLGDLTAALTSAEVAIEATHEPRKDRMFRVRMRLAMRAGVVVVPPDHPNNGAHEDVYCAIRNAFRAARRQLEAYLKEHPAVEAPAAPAVDPLVALPVDPPVGLPVDPPVISPVIPPVTGGDPPV